MHMRYADESFFVPDWWQTNYLRHDPRFLIVNKSRRIGWSYITSLKGLLKALDPAVFNYTKQFVSYNMADATEKNRGSARALSVPTGKDIGTRKLVSDQKTQLEFLDTNGRSRSRLISLASKAPRGKGGDISLDEFAFQQKDHDVYIGALPVISRGGNIEIGSTPFGNSGRFHDILTDRTNYPNFQRWNIPWYYSPALTTDMDAAIEAARGGMGQETLVMDYGTEILQEIYRSMPTDDFEQEYACSFRDSSASFITLEMIRACTPTGEAELPAIP
jgi:phage FluMu gp28-like protein